MAIQSSTTSKYTHLELNEDVGMGIARYYTPQREVRLKYNGREVLYVIGQAVIEASCCGAKSWTYAAVPGYIVNWQNTRNEDGLPVSEVERVRDDKAQAEIRETIQSREVVSIVEFW